MGLTDKLRSVFDRRNRFVGRSSSGGMPRTMGQSGVLDDLRVYANDVYYRDSAVFRCVSLISGAIASLPLRAVDAETLQPPRDALTNAGKFNEFTRTAKFGGQPFSTFMRQLVMDLLMHGNVFVLPDVTPRGRVTNLYLLRPESVTIVPKDATGLSFEYQYRAYITGLPNPASRPTEIYTQDDLILIRLPSVDDKGERRWLGTPPVIDDSDIAMTSLASLEYVSGFYKDGIRSRSVVEIPEGTATTQLDNLKDNINNWSNDNAFVSVGGKAYSLETNAMSSQERELRTQITLEVCNRYGVPPKLLLPQAAGVNDDIEQDMSYFVRFGLRHYMDVIEDTMGLHLLNEDYVLRFDESKLMRGDARSFKLWSDATSGVNPESSVTHNEKRKHFGMPPLTLPDGSLDPRGFDLIGVQAGPGEDV